MFPLTTEVRGHPSEPIAIPIKLPLGRVLAPVGKSPLSSFAVPSDFLLSASAFSYKVVVVCLSLVL